MMAFGRTSSTMDGEDQGAALPAPAVASRARTIRPLHMVANLVLVLVVAVTAWLVYQETFSAMPTAASVQQALLETPHAAALRSVELESHDAVLTYDLTGEPYFDAQTRYAEEFEVSARRVLDDFRRVERVHIDILQGELKFEGLSVTDGFGVLLSWL